MTKKFIGGAASILFCAVTSMAVCEKTNADAEAFIRSVYAHYSSDTYSSIGSSLEKVFSPQLTSLIKADENRPPKGYVGALDFDPLCECQDNEDLKLLAVNMSRDGSKIVNADVRLQVMRSSPDMTTLRLRLVHLPEGWRIDDVIWAQPPNLRTLLTQKRR